VFDISNEMTLEFLREKGPVEAARLVEGIPGFPEAAIARATLLTLETDAFPLSRALSRSAAVCRCCRRQDAAALAQQVRGLVPKQSMYELPLGC